MNDSYGPSATAVGTLVEILQRHAEEIGGQPAFSFYGEDGRVETLTFEELDRRARAIAAHLLRAGAADEPVLLIYPAGLDFIAGFFGCLYAGALAVPATYPKPRRPMPRLYTIAADCDARFALSTSQTMEAVEAARSSPELARVTWFASDSIEDDGADDWQSPALLRGESLALLQYTSGSTSDPRGVMVSHTNLLHNLEMIRQGFGINENSVGQTGVFWLPAYHDMGLIGGILEPLYVGGHSVLMSPQSFLQRPLRWLEMISQHRASISGGPNFAYDLSVQKTTPEQREQLDLSSWRVAFCGAEPIRPETLEGFAAAFAPSGFRRDAFYPCYGLAEATLLAAGGAAPAFPRIKSVDRQALAEHWAVEAGSPGCTHIQRLVGCGQAMLGQDLLIVDPESREVCSRGRVGEIWVSGPSVAQGYWNRPDETAEIFQARLADETNSGRWLRTGDLGFVADGNLFVTGRIKDVIIIRARNYYPQDLELTVQQSHAALGMGAGCACSIDIEGQERLVIIHEVERQFRDHDLDEIIREIRGAVAAEHELDVSAIALTRHASLPRTTSGKIQRQLCRRQYLDRKLKVLKHWQRELPPAASTADNGRLSDQAQPAEPPDESISPAQTQNGRAASSEKSAGRAPRRTPPLDLQPGPLTAPETDRLAETVETWLLEWLRERAGVAADDIARDKPFAEYGIDSLTAVELSQELEDWLSVRLTPVVAWNYPTAAALSRYLAEEVARAREPQSAEPVDQPRAAESDSDFEQMLADIEALSDEEAEAALREIERKMKEES